MTRCFCSLALTLWFTTAAAAQVAPYNPYAEPADDPSPVTADGKPNWPSFYKSAATQAKFQAYFEMGSCVGTRKSINNMLADNKVNINKLPEADVAGLASRNEKGTILLQEKSGQNAMVVAHPAGVSKISITGPLPITALQVGMTVRFLGKIDTKAQGTEPLAAMEVVSPSADLKPQELIAGQLSTVIGTITKLHGQHMQVKLATGKLHRATFTVTPETTVTVNASDLALIFPGDEVTAKGHLYAGQGTAAKKTVFADEIVVTKHIQQPASTQASE
ncbi:MAG TPA: hypothetical protein VL096_18000 [Pirellulaceae bacterium]|nr:hypothetical protein [Pirellulaceae bacterium]